MSLANPVDDAGPLLTGRPPDGDRPGLGRLRQLARARRSRRERCELCDVELPSTHEHLVEITSGQLVCSCPACALLFHAAAQAPSTTRYRRVPDRVQMLDDFQLSDAQWDSLYVPISIAFFYYSTPREKVVAIYPSPAGPTESTLELSAWDAIARANPAVQTMQRDVEALLVNRLDRHGAYQYSMVPIDRCYELVGLVRTHWHGLSGGTEVWKAIRAYFDRLQGRQDG